jgi:hypothetical protein
MQVPVLVDTTPVRRPVGAPAAQKEDGVGQAGNDGVLVRSSTTEEGERKGRIVAGEARTPAVELVNVNLRGLQAIFPA